MLKEEKHQIVFLYTTPYQTISFQNRPIDDSGIQIVIAKACESYVRSGIK
jgi:hypothetical protein